MTAARRIPFGIVLGLVSMLGPSPGADAAAPPALPRCPDSAGIDIAYRDPFVADGTILRPESLLAGTIEFWPTAGEDPACAETVAIVEMFVDETPVPLDRTKQRFVVDVGGRLRGHWTRLALTLRDAGTGASRTWEHSVLTVDASVGSRRNWVGTRLQESETVQIPPPDRLVLTLTAEDSDEQPVLDLRKDEFKVVVGGVTSLQGDAITGLDPPGANLPVRLLVALDASEFLVDDEAGLRFTPPYETYVDEVVLAGLQAAAASRLADAPSPPLELGFVRYARTAEWHARPFWRPDVGITPAQVQELRAFLLAAPPGDWLPGQAGGLMALEAMKGLWHFFHGRRGVFIAPRGVDVLAFRLREVFSASALEPPARAAERLADTARRMDAADGAVVQEVLQHTERRLPKVYAWLPQSIDTRRQRVFGALEKLAIQSGGRVLPYDQRKEAAGFAQGVQTAMEDLSRSYLLTVEIPNPQQRSRTKEILVRALRRDVKVHAYSAYTASRSLCDYLPSYLIDADPVLRLVAAGVAGSCGDSSAAVEATVARLLGGPSLAEPEPRVLARLLRSYVQLRLREMQETGSRKRRAAIRDELRELQAPAALLDPAVLHSYRAIAGELAGG